LQRENRRRLPPQLAGVDGRQVEGHFSDLRKLVSQCPKSKQWFCELSSRNAEALNGSQSKLTTRENGSLAMSKSVLFWYRLISWSARVPGR
jgi:hypothetical protein